MAEPKLRTIQARFGFADPDLKNPKHDDIIKWVDDNIEDILMELFSLSKRPTKVDSKWEAWIRTKEEDGQLIGAIDYRVDSPQTGCVLFEAKTKIDTLGDLFRQLNMYRIGYYAGDGVWRMKFVVVCPDDTEAERIQQQGFLFLKYDPGRPFGPGGL